MRINSVDPGLTATERSASWIANERTYNLLWALAAEGGAFLCECDRLSCTERIPMTPSEYVRLRDRREPIYASGHGPPIVSRKARPEPTVIP
jgi:hypothetical protein